MRLDALKIKLLNVMIMSLSFCIYFLDFGGGMSATVGSALMVLVVIMWLDTFVEVTKKYTCLD